VNNLGKRLVMSLMIPIAGIPVLAGVVAESWVIAGVFGWDWGTVFAWQVIPMTLFAVSAGLVQVWSGDLDERG